MAGGPRDSALRTWILDANENYVHLTYNRRMDEARPQLLIEGLRIRYGGTGPTVVDGLTLALGRGEIGCVVGSSGCGKTTLLRCIGGQLRPTGGTVSLEHNRVSEMSHAELYDLRRKMGMLFQFGALFTDMTVFENVAFPLREHTDLSETMIRDLVLMKLEAVGLRGAHALMPGELSGGMARRVALARAVALDPMLVMYDEPFAGLDPIALGVIGQLIRKLNDALGATSIMVTHDVHESLMIVDHIYFVSQGKIVAEGTPDEIRASTDPFVHQFVYAEVEGPVHFDYPAPTVVSEFLGRRARG